MQTTPLGYNLLAHTVMPIAVGLMSFIPHALAQTKPAGSPATLEKRSPEIRQLPLPQNPSASMNWRHINNYSSHAILLNEAEIKQCGQLILMPNHLGYTLGPGELFLSNKTEWAVGQRVYILRPVPVPNNVGDTSRQGVGTERIGEAEVVAVSPQKGMSTLRLLNRRAEISANAWVSGALPSFDIQPADDSTPSASVNLDNLNYLGEVVSVIGDSANATAQSVIVVHLKSDNPARRGQLLRLRAGANELVNGFSPEANAVDQLSDPTSPATAEWGKGIFLGQKGSLGLIYVTESQHMLRRGTWVTRF